MAEKWAARRRNPIINVYTADLDSLNGLNFGLNKGWLEFVVQNRSGNKCVEIDLSEERKTKLKNMLGVMRKETNGIVEKILRDKVKEENEKLGPLPAFRKKGHDKKFKTGCISFQNVL